MATFTVKQLEALKPAEREYTRTEGGRTGLHVRVYPDGRRVLFYYFVSPVTGRRRKWKLGDWPQVSLSKARERLKEQKDLVDDGKDPFEVEALDQEAVTVRALAELYIERWAMPRKRTWREDQRNLAKDVIPRWKYRKAKDIKKAHVIRLLDDVAARGRNKKKAHNSAQPRHVLAVLRRMFNFAVERDLLEKNPCQGVKLPVAPPEPRRRHLVEEEVRKLWHGLPAAGIPEPVQRILKLVLVTGQRPGEVAGMGWSEIDGQWWTIPAERMKNKREHRVYLPGLAMDILGPHGEGLVFSKPTGQPYPNYDVAKYLRRALPALGLEDVKPHDLRRTMATLAAKYQISPDIVDRILSHTIQSVRAKHYDAYDYDTEKRAALEKWSRRLRAIITGEKAEKVVDFPGGTTS